MSSIEPDDSGSEVNDTLLTGFLIALIIGAAAALAALDDAGRRELIGLAATAHITILPAWFGIALAFGFPDHATTMERLAEFGVNVGTLILAAALVFAIMRVHSTGLHNYVRREPASGRKREKGRR